MAGRFFAFRFSPLALAAAMPFAAAAGGGAPDPEYQVETLRYDGRVAGVKVAEMMIENGVSSNALPYHRFTVRSVGAARLFGRVDTEMWSETLGVGENACSLFSRRGHDHSVRQNDTMRLWPDSGLVVREMLDAGTSATSRVEIGSQDVATFFCNIGSLFEEGAFDTTNSVVRHVILDGKSHEVVITLGETNTLRTALGPMPVRDIEIISHSDSLFVRNKPKRIRLSTDYPAFLEMDIENRYGTQRFRLVEWERDGRPFHPVNATD